MRNLRKMIFWSGRNSGMSLTKTWSILLLVAILLVMIDLQVLWMQMDSPSTAHAGILQDRLRDGYSHSNDAFHQVFLSKNGSTSNSKRSSSLFREQEQRILKHEMNTQGLLSSHGQERQGWQRGKNDDGGAKKAVGDPERKEATREGHSKKEVAVVGADLMPRIPAADLMPDVTRMAEGLVGYTRSLKLKAHSKWIILDVTSGHCKETLASAPSSWNILAVGEAASLKGCSPPICFYQPSDLNVRIKMTGNSPPVFRRNFAYLTAILYGAQYVLDADCSTPLKKALRTLQFLPRHEHGPMYNETLFFNVYAHFGAWAATPRALSAARAKNNSLIYYVREFDGNVAVKHGVSATSPDVSSLGGREKTGKRFDQSTPPVFLGQDSFSPAVPIVSLYKQTALWALLMPCNASSPHCHVLRQLIQQRLFRDIDVFSGFYQIKTFTISNTSTNLNAGSSLLNVDKLVSLLHVWKCRPQSKFFDCVDALGDHLYEGRMLNSAEYVHVKAWVRALSQLKVAEPTRVAAPWRGVRKTSEVRVKLGSTQVRLESKGPAEEQVLKSRFVDKVADHCGISRNDAWFPHAQWRKPIIDDIVLIIVFNTNKFFWNNLPFTETIHRPFYKHIFYCVPNVDELIAQDKEGILRHVSFVETMSDKWHLMYECFTHVASMNIQNVRGYLQIGDDTLTNTWRYLKTPRDTPWIPQGFSIMRADEMNHTWNWYWWKKSRGRPAVLQALAELEQISGLGSDQLLRLDPNYNKLKMSAKPVTSFNDMYQAGKMAFPLMRPMLPGSEVWETPTKVEAVSFMQNYYKANRLSGRVNHRAMDFFYIPQAQVDSWVKFTHHFLKCNVLIELAVPTIHYGLVPRAEVNYVKASSVWGDNRNSSYTFYDKLNYFLHPFKMKAGMEEKDSRSFFCTDYMSTLFSELANLVKDIKIVT